MSELKTTKHGLYAFEEDFMQDGVTAVCACGFKTDGAARTQDGAAAALDDHLAEATSSDDALAQSKAKWWDAFYKSLGVGHTGTNVRCEYCGHGPWAHWEEGRPCSLTSCDCASFELPDDLLALAARYEQEGLQPYAAAQAVEDQCAGGDSSEEWCTSGELDGEANIERVEEDEE